MPGAQSLLSGPRLLTKAGAPGVVVRLLELVGRERVLLLLVVGLDGVLARALVDGREFPECLEGSREGTGRLLGARRGNGEWCGRGC